MKVLVHSSSPSICLRMLCVLPFWFYGESITPECAASGAIQAGTQYAFSLEAGQLVGFGDLPKALAGGVARSLLIPPKSLFKHGQPQQKHFCFTRVAGQLRLLFVGVKALCVLASCCFVVSPAPLFQLMTGQLQNPVDNIADDVNVWSFDTLRPDGVARAACLAPDGFPAGKAYYLVGLVALGLGHPSCSSKEAGRSGCFSNLPHPLTGAFRPLGPKFRSHGRCDALPLGDWLAFSGRSLLAVALQSFN